MPLFSAFTPFGHLAFSRRPSHGRAFYGALLTSLGGNYATYVGSHAEASAYARAMALARTQALVDRVRSQLDPNKAFELLGALCRDHGISRAAATSRQQLREQLAARMLCAQGCTRRALFEALSALLGTRFVALRIMPSNDVTQWPWATPGNGPGVFGRPELPPKAFALVDPITTVGATTFEYRMLAGLDEGERLLVGDVCTVQLENLMLAEKITVTATPSAWHATATFASAHDIGASILTGPAPVWLTTRRTALVVVTSAAAADPEVRRQVHALMARMDRVVSTWAIVEPSGANTIGPFTLGTTPLGTTTLEQIAIS